MEFNGLPNIKFLASVCLLTLYKIELKIFPGFVYTFLSHVVWKSNEMHRLNLYICLHLISTTARTYKLCETDCINRDLRFSHWF
jgi:hypothetical protein